MARPCGSGNGVTGATKLSYFQTFQKKIETARLSRPTGRRRDFKKSFSGLSRPRWRRRDFHDQGGYGATQETARLQRQRRDRLGQRDKNVHFQDFRHRSGDGTSLQTEAAETARLFRPRWIRRDSGNGATPKATARPAWPARPKCALSRLSPPKWRRHVFADRSGGDGATFQTKAERARLFRPMRRRRDFPDGGGDGATKIIFLANEVDTVRLSIPMWRRRDFSDQGGEGYTFQTIAETARPRNHSSLSRRRRRDFPEQGGDGATFQTNAEKA